MVSVYPNDSLTFIENNTIIDQDGIRRDFLFGAILNLFFVIFNLSTCAATVNVLFRSKTFATHTFALMKAFLIHDIIFCCYAFGYLLFRNFQQLERRLFDTIVNAALLLAIRMADIFHSQQFCFAFNDCYR